MRNVTLIQRFENLIAFFQKILADRFVRLLAVPRAAIRRAQPREAPLPEAVAAAMRAAKLPPVALGVVVLPLSGSGLELRHNATQAFNPASTMKLLTTYAALELLGPTHTWKTEAYAGGAIEGGVPIIEGGKIIGAIGVSGGSSVQDGQVAGAGAAVIK